MKNKNYLSFENYKIFNLKYFLTYRAKTYANKTEFVYAKGRKQIIKVSYSKFQSEIESLGTVFYDMGFKDYNIEVMGENSYAWILNCFSVINVGSIIMPIDKELL